MTDRPEGPSGPSGPSAQEQSQAQSQEQAQAKEQARELRRSQKEESRLQAKEARRQAKAARKQEQLELDQYHHDLRHSKDPSLYHGHRVVSSKDLNRVFSQDAAVKKRVRFRRRLVHGITLTLLVGVVVTGAVLAVLIVRGNLKVGPVAAVHTSAPVCPEATFDYRPNKQVHLRVYNSTRREGLAGTVAAELKKRGYHVDKVANKSAEYAGTAVVVSGPTGRAAAFNLQRNIAGTDYVADERSDASVDVYLTGAFQELIPAIQVDQTPGPLSCPRLTSAPTLPPASPGSEPTTAP